MNKFEDGCKAKGKEKGQERPTIESYMRMSEREKDVEIQKAVTRLQNRISEILYLLETETKAKIKDQKKEQNKAKKEEKKSE